MINLLEVKVTVFRKVEVGLSLSERFSYTGMAAKTTWLKGA